MAEKTNHIYLSVGEPSGEQHAACLLRELLRLDHTVRLTAMGGELLREAGAQTIADASAVAVTGFTEVLAHLGDYSRLLKQCARHILETKPEVVVLVDYPGFHVRLAKRIKQANPGQKIIYYICPKFWAWNYRRVKKLRQWIDEILCIFPFEPKLLQAEGIQSRFVGNPLLDQLALEEDGKKLRSELDINPEAELIGLLPGSRQGEVRRLLPPLLEAARIMQATRPGRRFIIAASPQMNKKVLAELSGCELKGFPVLSGRAHEVMAASDLLLATSGTATLEAALYGTPMVGIYKISAVTHWLITRMARIKHFTLPNLLLCDFAENPQDEVIIPELLQNEAEGERIAAEAEAVLGDEIRRVYMKQKLLSLRNLLGGPGASRRAAEAILEAIKP
ncbi:MAG: lipid-A-disaccharide synthase [Planctomycetes bacterium]|nr:lipid-A-disaccharide synthase [Planctomycetota bacterium]